MCASSWACRNWTIAAVAVAWGAVVIASTVASLAGA
jgi:hypothetical protein